MKYFFAMLLSFCFLFTACKNGTKVTHTETNDDGTTTTTSVETNNAVTDEAAMNKKMEELKKLPPLTIDQLKAILPEELNGIKRTNFNANTAMGYAVGEAEYQKDDTTKLNLVIYDCAGEAGSVMYLSTYWSRMNLQSENSQGYTKTIDFKGNKAMESYEKSDNQYSLTYSDADRLLVIITGRNISRDGLMDAAKSLNLKI